MDSSYFLYLCVQVLGVITVDTHHRAPVEAAAAKKVHIFLEKPIAATLEDADAIVAACRHNGVRLGIGFLLRWDPRYAAVKDLLESGQLGDTIHLSVRRNSPRTEGPARYGGSLPLVLHVTVHDLDMALWLLKPRRPISVYAQYADKLLGLLGTQDSVFAIVRFDDGTLFNIESSWALPATSRTKLDAKLEVVGTEGMAEVDCAESGLYVADAEGARFPDTQHWPLVRGRIVGNLHNELLTFVDDIRFDRHTYATGEEAVEALRLALALMESAATGRICEL